MATADVVTADVLQRMCYSGCGYSGYGYNGRGLQVLGIWRQEGKDGKERQAVMEIMRKVEMKMDGFPKENGIGADEAKKDLKENHEQKEIEDMVKLLDGFASSNDSRLKIKMSDELDEGVTKREYHHGRCDIGSPWACGTAFDAQTER